MSVQSRLEINQVDDVTVVHFLEKKIIETMRIQELGEDLFDLVEGQGRTKLVLNFAAVDFLSSAALGTLIKLYKKVKTKKGAMVLCSIRPEIYEVFRITNLDRVFPIKDDEADALAMFG